MSATGAGQHASRRKRNSQSVVGYYGIECWGGGDGTTMPSLSPAPCKHTKLHPQASHAAHTSSPCNVANSSGVAPPISSFLMSGEAPADSNCTRDVR